jgi:hypothetical protein
LRAILSGTFGIREEKEIAMKYLKSQMNRLVKEDKDLQKRLKDMMKEHDLEKDYALRALYHAEVADGGKYQLAYQALDLPKR